MNFQNAMPLIGGLVSLLSMLVKQIVDSVHMTEEEKKQALAAISLNLDATVEKVKNVKFDAL